MIDAGVLAVKRRIRSVLTRVSLAQRVVTDGSQARSRSTGSISPISAAMSVLSGPHRDVVAPDIADDDIEQPSIVVPITSRAVSADIRKPRYLVACQRAGSAASLGRLDPY